jgi:uncharacterized membrane protein YheB (UPF0754 family)
MLPSGSFLDALLSPSFWFQPVFYSLHGYIATEMAIWMLFHPYEAKYLPGTRLQLPFTPGIFPRGRHKLSVAIANTITEILLTKEDIRKQAQKLVTEENLYHALDALITSLGSELRDVQHLRQIYRVTQETLPPLLAKLLEHGIDNLNPGREGELKGKAHHPTTGFERLLRQGVHHATWRLLPQIQLTADQAGHLSQWLCSYVLTSDRIRQGLVALLNDARIAQLDTQVRSRAGLWQGLLLKVVDVPGIMATFRMFLQEHPETANDAIENVIEQIGLKTSLTEQLLAVSPRLWSSEALEAFEHQTYDAAVRVLQAHRSEVVAWVGLTSEEAAQSLVKSLLGFDWNQMGEAWLPGLKQEMARFLHTYLQKELENMVSRALPVISLNSVIIEKIDQFSSKELEETIQRICRRELRYLAFLGAFLGFWLGLLSNFVAVPK